MPTLQNKTFHFSNISNIDNGTITPGACAPYNPDQSKCNVRNAINFCANERQVSDCRIDLDPTKTYSITKPISISVGQTKNVGKGISRRRLFYTSPDIEPIHFNLQAAVIRGKPIEITLNGNGATVQGDKASKYMLVAGQPRSAKSVFTLTLKGFNFKSFGSNEEPGGALHIQGVDFFVLQDSTFTNCSASSGGAIYVSGNGTVNKKASNTQIRNCSFSNNTAGYGGR